MGVIVDTFHEQGYLLVEGVYAPEFVEELRQEADAVIARSQESPRASFLWGGKWLSDDERDKLRLLGTHEMEYHSAAYTRALLHPQMLDVAEAIIGPNVQLHHSKLIYKPPAKGGSFPLHQDHPFFPHRNHSMIAVSVHMDDTTVENGCLFVVPGSHKNGPIPHAADGNWLPEDEWPLERAIPCPAKAGDVLFFSYLTIHGSPPNVSDRPRRNVLFQFRDPEDEPEVLCHLSNGQGLMLRGINPNWFEVKRWKRELVEAEGGYDQG